MIIDTNNFKILMDEIVQSIEFNSTEINTYQKLNTLCNHAKVNKFNFSTKQSENFYVYEYENTSNIHPLLLPQALLECVQVEDESMSKKILSIVLVVLMLVSVSLSLQISLQVRYFALLSYHILPPFARGF
jgi:hypothetical protein